MSSEAKKLIRPRLTEFYDVYVPQNELDFAIPFLDEDIPLYVDPFLLWKSPSMQDQSLHQMLLGGFNNLGQLAKNGERSKAIAQLIQVSECDEVGLGTSASRSGKRIGSPKANEIVELFERVPYYKNHGFRHIEEIQLLVDGIGKDRISDISCNFLKSFLIDFTKQECDKWCIPTSTVLVSNVYDPRSKTFKNIESELPVHPETGANIILVPKRWLRFVPWLNYEQYFKNSCPQDDIAHEGEVLSRVNVLNYNRDNYGVVDAFVREMEATADKCGNDPLFKQIPIVSAKRKLAQIRKLPTGKSENSDIKYENAICSLLPSLLYPNLDFAQAQARTASGVSIIDLIFYNSRAHPFLKEIMDDYGARQITFELKNVQKISREHVDQLNRYLSDDLGKFGVFVTRHPLKKAEFARTIDLWSGQRKAVIALTDEDISQMVEVFASKQRLPMDILVKKYAEYRRRCP